MRTRLTLGSLSLVAASLLAACAHDPVAVVADEEAASAVAEFTRLADSLTAAGADADVANSYRALASAVRGMGQLTPVVISVDGAPAEYVATARELGFEPTGACAAAGALCLMAPPLRSMMAWQRGNPRRVVQLTDMPGGMPIGAMMPIVTGGGFLESATLTYFDGAGGVFVGSGGAQAISDPVVSDTPCWMETLPTISSAPTCRRATFTVSFSATLAPALFLFRNTAASGTHTITMASQTVAGARLLLVPFDCPTCAAGGYPNGYLPPLNLRPSLLPSTLTASVAPSGVTLTLAVTNPQSGPVVVSFTSGQQYDFAVRRLDGTPVWTWSAGKGFTQALTSRTLAPGETVTYWAEWAPASPGAYAAIGSLVSSSHHAGATTTFVVP